MKFYTLLHVAEKETSTHNNKAKSFAGQMQVYTNCIKLLQASLKHHGFTLTVITNNQEFLNRYFTNTSIDIVELSFTMNVPSGVNFYSPHYKNEVYKYFGTLNEKYVALIDSDIICMNKIPGSFLSCAENGIPLFYDISNQVHPVFGQDIILKDKKTVDKNAQVGIWAGGEFIAGPPSFFSQLYEQVEEFSESYFAHIKEFHHQSDEFLTSVAIENGILNKKYVILDAGILNIIGRFWSYPTIHKQPAFEAFKEVFLLHLPSNKKLLAGIDANKLNMDRVYQFLTPKLMWIHSVNTMKDYVKKMLPSKQH